MSPVRVTWVRTLGFLWHLSLLPLLIAGFFAVAAAQLAFHLEANEGGGLSLVALWTLSVAQILPALAAFLAMDVWSQERQSGRLEILFSTPVRERDLVLGKYLGVLSFCWLTVFAFWVVSSLTLGAFSDLAFSKTSFFSFLPGFFALFLQSLLWCAISVAASVLFRSGAFAAIVSLALMVALPRGLWATLLAWAPQGSVAFGEMPLDAQAVDLASGLVSSGTVIGYLALALFALFFATKYLVAFRFAGQGGRGLLFSTHVSILLAFLFAILVSALAMRTDFKLDLPVGTMETVFSERTRGILADTRGTLTVTCFLSRGDARFRAVGHQLRALAQQADEIGGVHLELRFVDPVWNFGAAERFIRRGVKEDSLIFEKGGRMAFLELRNGYGERLCASTILRLSAPPRRRKVYWTFGHGEASFEAYGPWGLSDIARELQRDGYANERLDLALTETIPLDSALVVVAGAKEDFSRVEVGRLEAYLKQGGRLLVLLNSVDQAGLQSLLPNWGILPGEPIPLGFRTFSGTDAVVDDFSEHRIAEPLKGTQIVLERPVQISRSAAVEGGSGADQLEFTPLASVDGSAVAAVVERGAGTGADLELRPTRVVVIGDAGLVMNAQLADRANANRDFFMNCVAFLSGTDASTAGGVEGSLFSTGMDRATRMRFILVSAFAVPCALLLLLAALGWMRRRRL